MITQGEAARAGHRDIEVAAAGARSFPFDGRPHHFVDEQDHVRFELLHFVLDQRGQVAGVREIDRDAALIGAGF